MVPINAMRADIRHAAKLHRWAASMLTFRERQVVELHAKGLYDNQIAKELHISNGRVAQLRHAATKKLFHFWLKYAVQQGHEDRPAPGAWSEDESE